MRLNHFFRISFFTLLLLVGSVASAQILAWQFTFPEHSDGKQKTAPATTVDENLEASTLIRGAGAQKVAGNKRGFSANLVACDSFEEAKAAGAYFQFVVKPKKGYTVSLRNLSTIMRRQEDAANYYRWTYSVNGKDFKELGPEDVLFEDTGNSGSRQPRTSLREYEDLQNVSYKTTIIFRLYAWGGKTNLSKRINFGFGKSGSKGNPVLALFGTVDKEE
ncbi:MAG: hypothetical protein GX102_10225 [Porphyromonadaceae bacterium]|nr:hypothetical protein [Porphyromonadaceae bacterium]